MKNIIALFLFASLGQLYAQNKTLGVGTPTPNTNAALHVESPTNNQGILIPRLTAAQRTTLTAALAAADLGLIVFDTDSRALAIWNGTGWDLGSKVGAPIAITNAGGTGNAATLVNSNASNANPTLLVNTSGTGNAIETTGKIQAGQFAGSGSAVTDVVAASVAPNSITSASIADNQIVDADVSASAAIAGSKVNPNFGAQNIATTGTATAASFLGDGSKLTGITKSKYVIADPASTDTTLTAKTFSNQLHGYAISGIHKGTGDVAGYFLIDNAASTFPTLYGENRGKGSGVMGNVISGSGSGVYGFTGGLGGNGGTFGVENATSDRAGVYGYTKGVGPAVMGETTTGFTGIFGVQNGGSGNAGFFNNTNAANASPVIQINNSGTGNAIQTAGNIQAGKFVGDGSSLTNLPAVTFPFANATSSASNLFDLTNTGEGSAGKFEIKNAASTSNASALFVTSNAGAGSAASLLATVTGDADGDAIQGISYSTKLSSFGVYGESTNGPAGFFSIPNAANVREAVTGITNGLGSAGNFKINNATSNSSALNVTTSGNGSAGNFLRTGTGTGGAAVFGRNQGPGPGGYFEKTNGSSGGSSVEAIQLGTGDGAAAFTLNNSASAANAVFAQTTGTGAVAYFTHNGASGNIMEFNNNFAQVARIEKTGKIVGTSFQGDGSLLTNLPALSLPFSGSNSSGSNALDVTTTGLGGAGNFQISNATNTSTVLNSITNGSGSAGYFSITNASNNVPALNVNSSGSGSAINGYNSGTGVAGYFQINNPSNSNAALGAITNGTGGAGSFAINNPISNQTALFATSNGTGSGIGANATGSGLAIYGNVTGTGGGANFSINNAANTSTALAATTNGTGDGGYFEVNNASTTNASVKGRVTNTGGVGGSFEIFNTTNSNAALYSITQGTGNAGSFNITNAASAATAVNINHSGTGNAITANRPIQATQFIGDGSLLTNLPSIPLPYSGSSTASANAFSLVNNSTTTGQAGQFSIGSSTNSSTAFGAVTIGTGAAGSFTISNAANANAAVIAGTNGIGGAGAFAINNTTNANNAVYGTTNGVGTGGYFSSTSGGVGNAAKFVIANATNTGSAFQATSNGLGKVGDLSNTNAANASPVLNITNAGTGNAITAVGKIQATSFQGDGSLLTNLPGGLALPYSNSISSSSTAFDVSNSGTGFALAASGRVNFVGDLSQSILSVTNNTTGASGGAAVFFGSSTGSSVLETQSTGNSAFQATHTGPSGQAALFNIFDASNPGSAIFARSLGTGTVGLFRNQNTTNATPVILAENQGLGNAAELQITNTSNSSAALKISHSGTGNAISANRPIQATQFIGDGSLLTNLPGGFSLPYSQSLGTGATAFAITNTAATGYAGNFSNTNTSNPNPTLFVNNNGTTGGALYAFSTSAPAGRLQISNTTSPYDAMIALTDGLGSASTFVLSNASNSSPAINISHSGTGNAITANRPIQATQFIGDGSALTNVIPSGIIMPFAGTVNPFGYLLCDGSAISRTTYANLFAAIGTSWGVGDGSTTFNLPDFRGRFMRGVDGGAGNDPDAATRTANNGGNAGNNVGSYQNDTFASHTHAGNGNGFFTNAGASPNLQNGAGGAYQISPNTLATGGNETRPKNAYVNYIIKY